MSATRAIAAEHILPIAANDNIYDASGTLVHVDKVSDGEKTDYVTGPMGTLVRITNGKVTYLHPDHLGSAQAGTTGFGYSDPWGTVAWREQYTPFGEEIQGQSANDDLAGFTGHIKDKATGLNYMQARYYDPVIGRFLSIDPVTFGQTGNPTHFNRYAYCGNNPINCTDPTGMVGVNLDPFNKRRQPSSAETVAVAGVVADFTPVVGSFKGLYEFANDPTPMNAVGIIPYGKLLKRGEQVTEILGNAQQTRKAGELTTHGSTSQRIAEEMAESGDYTSVHLNQAVKTITDGDVTSRVRPDVAGVRADGTVDVVEVLSPNQTSQQMTDKLQNALGDRCGAISCVAPD